jgi:hypothetical protein
MGGHRRLSFLALGYVDAQGLFGKYMFTGGEGEGDLFCMEARRGHKRNRVNIFGGCHFFKRAEAAGNPQPAGGFFKFRGVNIAQSGKFRVLDFSRDVFRVSEAQAAKPYRANSHFIHISPFAAALYIKRGSRKNVNPVWRFSSYQ